MKTLSYIGFSLCLLTLACSKGDGTHTAKPSSKRHYYNYIVAVDLSNRNLKDVSHAAILPVQHDTSAIYSTLTIFRNRIPRGQLLHAKDRIIVVPVTQPTEHWQQIQELAPEINIGALPQAMRWRMLDSLDTDFRKRIASMYSIASTETVIGADMWRFFNDQLEPLIIRDTLCINILVVLTDGYLYFDENVKEQRQWLGNKSDYMDEAELEYFRNCQTVLDASGNISCNWEKVFDSRQYGLIPVHKDFGNLSVLVLGLNPIQPLNNREHAILKKYWNTWFTDMGITKYQLHELTPCVCQKVIDDFVRRTTK